MPSSSRATRPRGVTYLFDTLMTQAQDEPGSMYGLVAESAELADDKRSVTFYLRPEAKFSDGTPVTAEDVVNSFTLLKEKGHPFYRAQASRCRKSGSRRSGHGPLSLQG